MYKKSSLTTACTGSVPKLPRRASYPGSHSPSHREEKEDKSTIVQALQTRRQLISTSAKGPSQRDMQMIVQSECPIAIWAFPRSRQSPFLDTLVAEDVPAGLDNRVLEVLLADGTDCHDLANVSSVGMRGTQLINSPAASRTRYFDCLSLYSSTIPDSFWSLPSAL